MSFEARASARRFGDIGIFQDKWLTVRTDSTSEAIKAFNALGYETRGCRVYTQEDATRIAETIARQ